MSLSGTGVPTGSVVTTVTSGTSITISQNATASGTVTLTALPYSEPMMCPGATSFTAYVTLGAASGPAYYQWQVAPTPTGPWTGIGTPTVGVASATTAISATTTIPVQFARLIVSTAATSQTGASVLLTAK